MQRLSLIIEKKDTILTGRIIYENNLIIVESNELYTLENKMKRQLKRHHQVNVDNLRFECKYDLSVLFEVFSFLKISKIAILAGVNSSLLRQYAIGNKHASPTQAKKIERTVHEIAKKLSVVQVYSKVDG